MLHLGSCFADLLDHVKRFVLGDYLFDLVDLMLRFDDEVERVRRDRVVGRRVELDRLRAREIAALAVKWQRRGDVVLLGALVDPLVDLAEYALVPAGSLGKVHSDVFPRRRPPILQRYAAEVRPHPLGVLGSCLDT